MNQSKLDLVKQEMAGVHINSLGIKDVVWFSELKWKGIGEFNSDDHYIYYCGQKSFRRNEESPHSQQKSLKYSTWVQTQKWQNDLCSFPRKIFNITVIQDYVPTTNAEEAKVDQFKTYKTFYR